jgi:hypothetical protein
MRLRRLRLTIQYSRGSTKRIEFGVSSEVIASVWLRTYIGLHLAFGSIKSTSISSTSDPAFDFHPYYRSIEHFHRAVIMAVATQDLNLTERALQTPRRGHVAADKTTTVPNSFDTILSASTASTVSSLAAFNNIWDLSETPTKQTSSAWLQDILAPLTPPTPPESSRKLNVTPISNFLFGVEGSPSAKQQLVEKKDVAVLDDPFQKPKMFRNLTFELQASELRQC